MNSFQKQSTYEAQVEESKWKNLYEDDGKSWADICDDETSSMEDPEDLDECLDTFMCEGVNDSGLSEIIKDNKCFDEWSLGKHIHLSDEQEKEAYEFFIDNYRDAQIGCGDYHRVEYPNKSRDFVCLTIGKSGCNLKRITEETGLNYMWYNRDGYFEMWGNIPNLQYAKHLLDCQANWAMGPMYY